MISRSPLPALAAALAGVGADPADGAEVRLRKVLLVFSTALISLAGAVWGVLYLLLAQGLASLVPAAYVAASLGSTLLFARDQRYEAYRARQLLLILLLPFLLMLALGGFAESSAVILWSLLSPLGALLLSSLRAAVRWFAAYLFLVLASLLLQPYVQPRGSLPPEVVSAFFALNIVGPSSVAFILLHYFVGQKDRFLQALQAEQQKSENLLLSILPHQVALRLKEGRHTIADHYAGASILFADLVGFTPLSAELPPHEMVEMLNQVFSHFDSLAEHYEVEKIRTIGDSYMAAAGVPAPRADHAQALACMALDMLAYCAQVSFGAGRRLAFRIGINSGPVVAGVIGRKKFIYDLWGDAVNTASRMESHGLAGKIQIAEATYHLLKDEFVCEARGAVEVKGKGRLPTWFLLGRRAGAGSA